MIIATCFVDVGFNIVMAVTMKFAVIGNIMPCSLVGSSECFRENLVSLK
jgi:hypothetical protein